MKFTSVLILLLLSFFPALAQTPPAGLDCEGMREWLKQNFYDGQHQTLDYTLARKKMYAYIDNINDTITCVYSGYKVVNPYGNEVSYPAPINTEHTVPQSFFSELLPMRSDIHHLFPSYDDWNNERSDNPFREIPDNQTTKWMYLGNSLSTIPTININAWSESDGSTFEPREAHKGNLARAVMYFYTMYPTQAGTIDQVADVDLLLQWNEQDPPDAAEESRNAKVEQYQGNANPYILHPEWAVMAWGDACLTPVADVSQTISDLRVYPNPVHGEAHLLFALTQTSTLQLRLINAFGETVLFQSEQPFSAGTHQWMVPLNDLPAGAYWLMLDSGQQARGKMIWVN